MVREVGMRLTAYDFGGTAVGVLSRNSDGASFTWPDAFALKHKDWHLIFTEHYGYHMFHADDVELHVWNGEELALSKWKPSPESAKYLKGLPRRRKAEQVAAKLASVAGGRSDRR